MFLTAALLVQSCISSKRTKGEIEQKVHSWGLMVKGNRLWTRLLKCCPDLCLLMCIKFPHIIVATRVTVYRKFSSQMREKLRYSEEKNCLLFFSIWTAIASYQFCMLSIGFELIVCIRIIRDVVKPQLPGILIQWVWVGAQDSALPANPQVMLTALACVPHFWVASL